MVLKAPMTYLLGYVFRRKTNRTKLIFCQLLVLFLTYITYMSYHAAKRPFSVVKGVLSPDCNVTTVNNTCFPWPPFTNKVKSKELFGLLDCAFLITYALAMFVSGFLAEHSNLRIYLSSGMFLTGLFTSCLGLAYYFKVHNLAYFFVFLVLTGVTQPTGWPCVVECVGMWFPKGRRGLIMGLWNTHVSVGNIVGSAVAGVFASHAWGLSFIVPGIMIASIGVLNFFFLIPDPSHVGLLVEKPEKKKMRDVGYDGLTDTDSVHTSTVSSGLCDTVEVLTESEAVGICSAIRIPGVLEYSFCLFFAKLVSYTFLFWLPYYIIATPIGGSHLNAAQSADLATLFDVGGAFGGIIAGVLVDTTKRPGLVNVIMLIVAAPCLFLFKFHGTVSYTMFITYMVLCGFFVNGPYALITTAVSASLGSHKSLEGNTKAMAIVTAIIDGTGSLGAAIGPLLAGVLSVGNNWDRVFYMLISADILAALLLSRQVVSECLKSRCCRGPPSLQTTINGEGDGDVEREALLRDGKDA